MCRTICLVFILILSLDARAQQPATANLNGRVVDSQGAVIARAGVLATQKATGIRRETTSNEDGLFVLTNLPPGEYEVKVSASGFAAKSYSAVILQVGQSVTLDTALEVGAISDIDHTYGGFELINRNSAVVDGVITRRAIEGLPLNGRNFLELALLIPGNSPAPNFDPTKTNTVLISSAGQLGRGGSVAIDGADNNDDVVGGSLQNISQEAVQEFQIATNRFSAELGRSGSSVINIVTKAGTNDFHGSSSFYIINPSAIRDACSCHRSSGRAGLAAGNTRHVQSNHSVFYLCHSHFHCPDGGRRICVEKKTPDSACLPNTRLSSYSHCFSNSDLCVAVLACCK